MFNTFIQVGQEATYISEWHAMHRDAIPMDV